MASFVIVRLSLFSSPLLSQMCETRFLTLPNCRDVFSLFTLSGIPKKREEREKSAFLSVREDVLCVIMRGYWIYRMVHRQRKEKPLLTFDTFFTGLQLKRREEKNPLLFFLFLLLVKWIDPEPFMFIWCSPRGM